MCRAQEIPRRPCDDLYWFRLPHDLPVEVRLLISGIQLPHLCCDHPGPLSSPVTHCQSLKNFLPLFGVNGWLTHRSRCSPTPSGTCYSTKVGSSVSQVMHLATHPSREPSSGPPVVSTESSRRSSGAPCGSRSEPGIRGRWTKVQNDRDRYHYFDHMRFRSWCCDDHVRGCVGQGIPTRGDLNPKPVIVYADERRYSDLMYFATAHACRDRRDDVLRIERKSELHHTHAHTYNT